MAVRPLTELGVQKAFDAALFNDYGLTYDHDEPDLFDEPCPKCNSTATVGWIGELHPIARWCCEDCNHLWDKVITEAFAA